MTPSEAVDTIRYQVAESSANFFEAAEIYGYLTQAERELANYLECNIAVTAFTATTGTYSYTTGVTDFVNIEHVTYNNGSRSYKLKGVDFRDLQSLDDLVMTSSATAGDPEVYWRNGDAVIMWPTPDASGTCNVYGTKVCTAVVSGATAFTVPNFVTEYLPDFALYRMYLKDQDDSRANMHLKLWKENKELAKREYARRKYSDRLLVVKTEDNYPTVAFGMV